MNLYGDSIQEEIFNMVKREVVYSVEILKQMNINFRVPDLEKIEDPTLTIPAMALDGKIFYNPYWIVRTITVYCQQNPPCGREILFGIYGGHEFAHLLPDEILFNLLGERIEGPFSEEMKADKFTGLMLALAKKEPFIVRKVIAELPWKPNLIHPPGYFRAKVVFAGYSRGLELIEEMKRQKIEEQRKAFREVQNQNHASELIGAIFLFGCVGLLIKALSGSSI